MIARAARLTEEEEREAGERFNLVGEELAEMNSWHRDLVTLTKVIDEENTKHLVGDLEKAKKRVRVLEEEVKALEKQHKKRIRAPEGEANVLKKQKQKICGADKEVQHATAAICKPAGHQEDGDPRRLPSP